MINLIGNFLDSSGYSIHTRMIANALNKLIEVRLDSMVQSNQAGLLNDQEVEMLKREPEDDQVNLIITNPMHWGMHAYAKRNWAYMIWEGDRVPKSFIVECLNPDIEYILCPSEHTRKAIFMSALSINDGAATDLYLRKKVKVIPHGVDLNIFKPRKEKEE